MSVKKYLLYDLMAYVRYPPAIRYEREGQVRKTKEDSSTRWNWSNYEMRTQPCCQRTSSEVSTPIP